MRAFSITPQSRSKFGWYNAGIDPVEFLEAHKDRIKVIHLKDGIPCAEENRTYELERTGVEGLSLGEGQVPVEAARKWAIKNNVMMVVESEGLDPTGLQEIRRCIDFLHTLD